MDGCSDRDDCQAALRVTASSSTVPPGANCLWFAPLSVTTRKV